MARTPPPLISPEHFIGGFDRCAKIIINSANYDKLICFDKAKFEPIVNSIREKTFEDATDLICNIILNRRLRVFTKEPVGNVVFFGRTKNNIRELDFFRRAMNFAPSFQITEIEEFGESREGDARDQILNPLRPAILVILRRYHFGYFLTRQFLEYISNILSFYLSFCAAGSSLRMLVVANDHSPAQVAATVVAKTFRLKRVYLQHSAITRNFPALDFDYAILNDKNSEKLYREIGETSCETLVIQRAGAFDEQAWRLKLNSIANADSVHVVLYLSSSYDTTAVENACAHIQKNSSVIFLGIKYHPATGKTIDGIPRIDNIPEFPHVAIAGNSSITLELIRGGNIVYLAKVDDIPFDYYGFFREGLCQKIDDLDDLGTKFWLKDAFLFLGASYAQSVCERFSEDTDRRNFVLRKIYIDSLPPTSGRQVALKLLDEIILYPSTYFRLACKTKNCRIPDHELIKKYDSLFAERILPFDTCLNHLEFSSISSITQFWFFAKKIEWSGFDPGERGIFALTSYVANLGKTEGAIVAWAESRLLAIMLRYAEPRQLIDFLLRPRSINVRKLNPNHKVALLRYMDKFPDQDFKNIYDELTGPDSLSGLALLKVAIQADRYALFPKIESVTHHAVESNYLHLVNSDLRSEYERYVHPFFSAKRRQTVYIDINHSDDQRSKLVDEIISALRSKEPYSLVRLGDGEGYFFQKERSPEGIFSIEDAKNRERHWWGEEIPGELRSQIIDRGLQSILTANVIGVPTIFRFLRDTGPNTRSLLSSLQARGMISVLGGVLGMNLESVKFTDSQLNVSLFSDIGVINRLASSAERVVIVNGAKQENLVSLSDNLKNAICIEIPTHSKQRASPKFVSGTKPLPYLFENLLNKMLKYVEPGTLVLVGGGVVGKAFLSAAKAAGGCGVDVGSAFDQLTGAGIHSLY
jgi:hypothetical protein